VEAAGGDSVPGAISKANDTERTTSNMTKLQAPPRSGSAVLLPEAELITIVVTRPAIRVTREPPNLNGLSAIGEDLPNVGFC
jgi:hypothetical protein